MINGEYRSVGESNRESVTEDQRKGGRMNGASFDASVPSERPKNEQ